MAKAGDKRRVEANASKLRLLRIAILAALVRLHSSAHTSAIADVVLARLLTLFLRRHFTLHFGCCSSGHP